MAFGMDSLGSARNRFRGAQNCARGRNHFQPQQRSRLIPHSLTCRGVIEMAVSARTWFPISSGLLTWDHYQRIGPAWMVFCWMIHEQRAPKDGEENTGAVRNGDPISYEGIGACLHGMPARTVEKHIAILEREGYIRSKYIGGRGKRYSVANPIRWLMVLPRNGELLSNSPKVGSCNSPEMGAVTPQNRGHQLPKTGEDNKEQKPKTKNKIKSGEARPTLEQIRAYCKERNNRVDPDKWFDHYTANGFKVGPNPMKDWKAAVRNWETNGVNHANGNRAQQRQASNLAAAAEAKRDFGLVG